MAETNEAEAQKKFLEFPANIRVAILNPKPDTTGLPKYGVIEMFTDKMPIKFTVDTPDPTFLNELAKAIADIALELSQNPENEAYIGQHEYDLQDGAGNTVAAAPAANNPEPALGEEQ